MNIVALNNCVNNLSFEWDDDYTKLQRIDDASDIQLTTTK